MALVSIRGSLPAVAFVGCGIGAWATAVCAPNVILQIGSWPGNFRNVKMSSRPGAEPALSADIATAPRRVREGTLGSWDRDLSRTRTTSNDQESRRRRAPELTAGHARSRAHAQGRNGTSRKLDRPWEGTILRHYVVARWARPSENNILRHYVVAKLPQFGGGAEGE
eukprot:9476276-Pyramimonas_sp.AAC.1